MHHQRTRTGTDARAQSASRRVLTRIAAVAVVALAAFLLHRTLRNYTLAEIAESIAGIPAARIAGAFGFAAASYLCLTGFDFLATRYVGARLPYRYVALASFCSLSLGHNIGLAALSSGAIRYRFYSRRGVAAEGIAKIILFCGLTVGIGLATLGGLALMLRPDLARTTTGLSNGTVLALGLACLAVPAVYVLLAATLRRRVRIRGWSFELPRLPLALGQIVIGALNFACVAACLHQVLAGANEVSYLAVAAVYVIANVASLITHVPGGLGVIETVVSTLLPQGKLIGALVAFRVIYFLVPLGIGGTLFALTELIARRKAQGLPEQASHRP